MARRAARRFQHEPFAQVEIARLNELRCGATEDRIEADLALGHHAAVVSELEALIAVHPLRERLHQQLMIALYRCGRQAEALAVYWSARRALVEELGIEPGQGLQRVERAILEQDVCWSPRRGPGRRRHRALAADRRPGRAASSGPIPAADRAGGEPRRGPRWLAG